MFQRLSISLAKVKAGNTSENVLSEICRVILLCIERKKVLNGYITI